MGLINFAHGELMTIAGYVLMYCGLAGISFVFAVPLALLASTFAAILMERVAFRPVRNSSGATMLVTSFAVAMILQVLFQNLISVRSQPVILPRSPLRQHYHWRPYHWHQQAGRHRFNSCDADLFRSVLV